MWWVEYSLSIGVETVKWRLIVDKGHDPYWNMAFDEAMLLLRERDKIPNTVRLYYFSPSSITIGYFQRIRDVVNLDFAEEKGIPYTRRITGGGAVYHDENGEITYSVVALLEDFPSDVIERYRYICSALMKALEKLGLNPVFKPVNDILVNNKKISGSAQTWRRKAFLQHGTLMYATDLDVLANSLKPPREKLESHGVKSIRERVTTVTIELGRRVDRGEVVEALIYGFRKVFQVDLEPSKPTREEIELTYRLREKYLSHEWIFRK